jgi:hypothetical protein
VSEVRGGPEEAARDGPLDPDSGRRRCAGHALHGRALAAARGARPCTQAGCWRDEGGIGRVLAGRSARRPAAGGGRRQARVAAALCVEVAGRGTGVWEPRIWDEGDGLMER